MLFFTLLEEPAYEEPRLVIPWASLLAWLDGIIISEYQAARLEELGSAMYISRTTPVVQILQMPHCLDNLVYTYAGFYGYLGRYGSYRLCSVGIPVSQLAPVWGEVGETVGDMTDIVGISAGIDVGDTDIGTSLSADIS